MAESEEPKKTRKQRRQEKADKKKAEKKAQEMLANIRNSRIGAALGGSAFGNRLESIGSGIKIPKGKVSKPV